MIKRKAYAKVNLALDVIRKRPDGYHDVKMIMQNVGIYDDLTFEKTDKPGVELQVLNGDVPVGEDNLICKAAKLLLRDAGIDSQGVNITLKKRIPVAAGMAGGSTDAAAAFHGINELFELGYTTERLRALGLTLGADIPYCILGKTALSEGIGEILTPIDFPPKAVVLVAKPDINVSTAFVYGNLKLSEDTVHPDVDGMVSAIRAGDLEKMAGLMGNVLATVTEPAYPIIGDIKKIMMDEGALAALMSGSGPTVFGLYTDENSAQKAALAIKEQNLSKEVFVTEFV